MKNVTVWFSEKEWEQLKREAEKKGVSVYSLAKQRILAFKQLVLVVYLSLISSAALAALYIWLLFTITGMII